MKGNFTRKVIKSPFGEHTLINNNQVFNKAYITCDDKQAIEISSSTVIISDSSLLKEVIQYYKNCSYEPKLTLLANSHDEVVNGMDEGITVHFKENVIKTKLLSNKKFVLERYKHLSKNEVDKYASKVLFHLLTDYPFTTVENSVDTLCSLNAETDRTLALTKAKYMTKNKQKRLLSRKKVTNKGYTKSWAPLLKPTSYLNDEFGNVFIDNGSTGTGKSKKIRTAVIESIKEGIKSVFICHRRSISSTSLRRIEGVGYYDDMSPGQENDIQCLVIVVNSILKSNFDYFLSQVDLVILEEGRQVFDHIMIGGCDNPEKVYNKVLNLCHQAKTVVIADADANNETLLFAQQLKSKAGVRLLYNEADFSDITIEFCRHDYIKSEIYSAAKADGFTPFIISTDTKVKVKSLNKLLIRINDTLKILTIHGDNNKENEQQAFLELPDEVSKNYDVIIYNSAITSSVSITIDRFTKHYALFQGIVTSSNALQMLRRNRPCKHFYVGVKPNYEYLAYDTTKLLETDNKFNDQCALLKYDENFDKKNAPSALYFSAINEGFNVNVNNSEPVNKGKPSKEINEETKQLHNLLILRSDIRDCQHYDKQDNRIISKKKHMELCHKFYLLIFDTLDIDVLTGKGSFTKVEANLLIDKIYEEEHNFKKIKLINMPRNGKPTNGTKTVNKILCSFGFIAERNNSKAGSYIITEDSRNRMSTLIKQYSDITLADI